MSDNNDSGRASRVVGSLLVIMITGMTRKFIAEVVQELPLVLEVVESGPLSRLKGEDFVIFEKDSLTLQMDDPGTQKLLREAVQLGKPFASGLEKLGVEDGVLREIWPVE